MKVIKNITEMQELSNQLKQNNRKIGLVPTMGFLHEGHLSLIRIIKKNCDICVVSIFINPTQFGPTEDFEKYPRDFSRDKQLCNQEGTDIIFYPSAEDLYRNSHKTFIITEDLSKKLCGITRPTHFRGVTTIVAKLFNIVKPDNAIFGQKDAQQFVIIKRMVEDLNYDIKLIMAPIVRDKDGLAMSSRNKYLNSHERKDAFVLYKSLQLAKNMIKKGEKDTKTIGNEMRKLINNSNSASLDYLSFVDINTLEPVNKIRKDTLIALAVFIGDTRLIDNIIISSW